MARYPRNSSPKLTQELITNISDAIRLGAKTETAIASCGISKDTFYRWLKDAKKDGASDLHLKLSDEVERASAEVEMKMLKVINEVALGVPETYVLNEDGSIAVDLLGYPKVEKYKIKPNWRASVWLLERLYSEQWNPEEILDAPLLTEEEMKKNRKEQLKYIEKRLKYLEEKKSKLKSKHAVTK
jgi:peroxiredoxin